MSLCNSGSIRQYLQQERTIRWIRSLAINTEHATGSIIAVKSVTGDKRASFQAGDVITFMEEENRLVTHRITEVTETGSGVVYTTKGDNNNAVDSALVFADNVVGVYTGFTVPYAGNVSSFAQSPEGSAFLMILPLFLKPPATCSTI